MYIKRHASTLLRQYLDAFPVVGMTGPRQSGKSTFLQHSLPEYHYVTFDLDQNVDAFESDPQGFIESCGDRVVFDEVQFAPKIFNAIKVVVDQDRMRYGRFVLTGSSQFSYIQSISESLAGRMGLMNLLPFQYAEMPKALFGESVYRGAYPELVMRDYRQSDFWYASYIDTYLAKDVRTLSNIGDMRDFRRFLHLLAANASQILDMSYYARDIGVSVPTIKRWVSVLEASYIIFLVPPYYKNVGKRMVKRPKCYFYDTGLVSYLTGIQNKELYEKGPMSGALFENHVIVEITKALKHSGAHADVYFVRTHDKAEIDLVVDWRNRCDLIEIKQSSTFRPKMATHLKSYGTDDDRRLVLYQGSPMTLGAVEIMPYTDYLDHLVAR